MSDLVEGGQEASAQYWPSSGSYQYGDYTVELMGEEPLEEFVIGNLSVMDIKVHKIIVAQYFDDHYHKCCNRLRRQWMQLSCK